MKKLIITFLFLSIAMPVFSAPNWKEGINDNIQPYDISEEQNLAKELRKNFYDMVDKGQVSCSGENYHKYVVGPVLELLAKQQAEGKDGFYPKQDK